MNPVIDASPNMNHITPDTFVEPVEVATTVNLDDIAEICPGTNLLEKPAKNENQNVSTLIESQPPAVTSNPLTAKTAVNKRYNIGKNASTLFKNKTQKLPGVKGEKKEKLSCTVADNTESLNVDVNEENKSKPVINSTEANIIRSSPKNEIINNNNMTVACTAGLNSPPLDRYLLNLFIYYGYLFTLIYFNLNLSLFYFKLI